MVFNFNWNLIKKAAGDPPDSIMKIMFVRGDNWIPVSLINEYDIHDFFEMYHWGRKQISDPLWTKAMEKTFTHMIDIKYKKCLKEWILYFPTEEDALAFKMRF